MGNFYTNYTLRGPSQGAVAMALSGRRAMVTPSQKGCVVVFDEESDEQDQGVIADLAADLSGKLRCPVLAVLNHDDDIFWYQLYQNGELADEYDSSPGYFDTDVEPSAPSGGDAARLCAAFAATDVKTVDRALRKPSFGDDSYAFALERHEALVRALGLPEYALGGGYLYIDQGELPGGLSADDLMSAD